MGGRGCPEPTVGKPSPVRCDRVSGQDEGGGSSGGSASTISSEYPNSSTSTARRSSSARGAPGWCPAGSITSRRPAQKVSTPSSPLRVANTAVLKGLQPRDHS